LKKQAVNILKFIFFLGLGLLFVWLAVKNITPEEREHVRIALEQANYTWIIISFLITALSHYLRAIRWKTLLSPLGYHPKASNSFFAVMVGYLANLALPRVGEVTRCGMINQYEKVPFTVGFGTVIAERALDLLCLIFVFFITLFIEFDRIYGLANELIFTPVADRCSALLERKFLLLILATGLLAMIGSFFYFRKKLQEILSSKVKGFVNGLWQGLLSIKDIKQPVLFTVQTLLIWLMYVLQVYVCFFAFSGTSHLTFAVAMVLNVFGSVAIIIIPGGTGLYQTIVIQILATVYLIEKASAIAFAWAVWSSQIIIILLLGLVSLILLPLLNKQKGNQHKIIP
jgi:uncharacterized protein (TIRG00374 family)